MKQRTKGGGGTKKVSVAAITVLAAACAPAGAPRHQSPQTPHCVQVVVNSLAVGDASGLWECMNSDARAHYFYANGWHDDKSVASTLNANSGDGLDVLLYAGNPLSGNVWLLYAAPDNGEGQPDLTQGSGLKITLDQGGKIAKIE